ncbi:MAG: DUF1641 domain-containing protein [Haloferacaceae archaeon]
MDDPTPGAEAPDDAATDGGAEAAGSAEAAGAALDDETRAALEAAVAENPEAVVAFVQRLDLVNDLLVTTELATAAMDDEMVTRLAGSSSLMLESVDGLATRETAALASSVGDSADDLESALETVLRLERAGTLDELAELADAAALVTAALDDEMVTSLASTGGSLGEVADAASDPETVRGVRTLLRAVGEASRDPPERVGLLGLLRSFRDAAVRRGIGFLLAVARGVGRDLDRRDATE